MNRTRRKELNGLVEKLREVQEALEILKEEEEGYLENMPENLMGSERYEAAEQAVDGMDNAISDIDTVVENIELATGEE